MGIADFSAYAKRVNKAYHEVDRSPTPAQREALNYRHGKVHLHGLPIVLEIPKGGTRTGTGPDGKTWKRVMTAGYGRIKRTVGRDGEPVDIFLGPHPESQLVFVISQLDKDGNLDEHKCVLGTRNVSEAKQTYLSNYPDWWGDERMGEVRGMFMSTFREWLKTDAPRKNSNKKAAGAPDDDGACGMNHCPKCDKDDVKWRNDVLLECNDCNHIWFAHEKRSAERLHTSKSCPHCESTDTKMMGGPVGKDLIRTCTDCGKQWMDGFAERMWPDNKETPPSVTRLMNAYNATKV